MVTYRFVARQRPRNKRDTSRCLVTASTVDVPLTLGSRTIPVPQLLASKSNISQGLNRINLFNSHTNQLNSTALN
jgi:hypothetical protein